MKSTSKKPTPPPVSPVLALSSLTGLSIAQTATEFIDRVRTRQRAFVEQGKLVYHLKTLKLKTGQSIYSILQGKGVPPGSVQQAITTANLIEELVIKEHVSETRFDEIITFRIARQSYRLLTGKAAIQLAPEAIASMLATGTSAAIGAELDCLAEHGMTIAGREMDLQAKAAEAETLRSAAAAAQKLKNEETARTGVEALATAQRLAEQAGPPPQAKESSAPSTTTAPEPEKTPAPAVAPTVEEPDTTEVTEPSGPQPEPDKKDEPEDTDDAPEPVVVDGTRRNNPPPPPSGPTLAGVTERFNDLLVDALDLPPEDLAKLVAFLRTATNDIASTLENLRVEVAA